MEAKLKVTQTNDEVSFAEIMSGDNVVNVPLFQRSYRWGEKNFDDLWADVVEIADGKVPAQFLGVLVIVPQAWQFGKPRVSDVVDGQQRLTTCYLTCLAIADVLVDIDAGNSAEIAKKLLLNRAFPTSSHNTKVVPSAGDRAQFSIIWTEYNSRIKQAKPEIWDGFGEPIPPTPSGPEDGAMLKQYRRIRRKVAALVKGHGSDWLIDILNTFVSKLSFVSISLVEPSAAPKIFERLNARGEKITTADLVRNEVFSRVSDDPIVAQVVFASHWEPFAKQFNEHNRLLDEYLFPYGLTINSSTTKSDLFRTLRAKWNALGGVKEIIDDLARFCPAYFALTSGKKAGFEPGLDAALHRLWSMQAPSSIFPFVFSLTDAVRMGAVSAAVATSALDMVENFLFRRAICGIEPTGLHAAFKGLWNEIGTQSPDGATVRALLSKRTTVPWPGDEEFVLAIKYGDLYRRNVKQFALKAYEIDCHGETPKDDFWIEHIMPQTLSGDWEVASADHAKWKNAWANLIPLTDRMNPGVGQKGFAHKVNQFGDSIFASAREIASTYKSWGPAEWEHRASHLAEWALKRWPWEQLKE